MTECVCDVCGEACKPEDNKLRVQINVGDGHDVGPSVIYATVMGVAERVHQWDFCRALEWFIGRGNKALRNKKRRATSLDWLPLIELLTLKDNRIMNTISFRKKSLIGLSLLTVGLGGCGPSPDMTMYGQARNAKEGAINDNARATVTRIGVFEDDLAYNGKRGVYLIRDEKTGSEYIGVSGIGIGEIGSHSQVSGKVITSQQDER